MVVFCFLHGLKMQALLVSYCFHVFVRKFLNGQSMRGFLFLQSKRKQNLSLVIVANTIRSKDRKIERSKDRKIERSTMFESLQHCDPSMYVHIVVGSGSYKTSTTNMDHHKKKQIACTFILSACACSLSSVAWRWPSSNTCIAILAAFSCASSVWMLAATIVNSQIYYRCQKFRLSKI